jgi:fructosamine-3-kinase
VSPARPAGEDVATVVRRLTGAPPRAFPAEAGPGGPIDLADGRLAVLKCAYGQPRQVAAEVAGLRWLAEPGRVPVPDVLGHDEDWLLVEYLPAGRPDRAAATRLGRELAELHAAGAPRFGAAPPGGPVQAWIGRAPMTNLPGHGDAPADAARDWPSWYAEYRVRPYLRMASDAGQLTADEINGIEAACQVLPEVAGPPVRPARLHGDLWSGNVRWSPGPANPHRSRDHPRRDDAAPVRAWLIDPAAHGGHPETDLAMLALFGCPHLDAVLAGYQQVRPLAPGWADRVGLHQLFPLLVHVVLFGRGYAGQAVAAARSTLRLATDIP